jgi:hypothetical protein
MRRPLRKQHRRDPCVCMCGRCALVWFGGFLQNGTVESMGAQWIPPDGYGGRSRFSELPERPWHSSQPFPPSPRWFAPLHLELYCAWLGPLPAGGGIVSADSSSSSTTWPHEAAPRSCAGKPSSSPTAPRWIAHPLPPRSYQDALLSRTEGTDSPFDQANSVVADLKEIQCQGCQQSKKDHVGAAANHFWSGWRMEVVGWHRHRAHRHVLLLPTKPPSPRYLAVVVGRCLNCLSLSPSSYMSSPYSLF